MHCLGSTEILSQEGQKVNCQNRDLRTPPFVDLRMRPGDCSSLGPLDHWQHGGLLASVLADVATVGIRDAASDAAHELLALQRGAAGGLPSRQRRQVMSLFLAKRRTGSRAGESVSRDGGTPLPCPVVGARS